MCLTKGQINGGTIHKWGNERKENNTMGVVPYKFHNKITEKEREVVKIILDRFNKDLEGCLSIR